MFDIFLSLRVKQLVPRLHPESQGGGREGERIRQKLESGVSTRNTGPVRSDAITVSSRDAPESESHVKSLLTALVNMK